MYEIYFVNQFYYSPRQFTRLDHAIDFAQSTGFDCRVELGREPVVFVDYLGGVRHI